MSCGGVIVMFLENFFLDFFGLDGNVAFFLPYSVVFFLTMGILELFVKGLVLLL